MDKPPSTCTTVPVACGKSPRVLREELVRVYAADKPAEPRLYGPGEHAEAEHALPGWSMPVDDLVKGSRKR